MTRTPRAYEVRMADAIAARHGLTDEQRARALTAIVDAPASLPHPTRRDLMLPVDLMAVALAAAGVSA